MAGPTNPRAQTAGRPAGIPPEQDPQAWANQGRPQRQLHQVPQQGYAPAYPPQAEAPQADPYAQTQAYHYPAPADPYAGAPHANAGAGYAQQYDPYRQVPANELPPQQGHDQWQAQNRQGGLEPGYDAAGHFHSPAFPPGGEWGAQQHNSYGQGVEPGFDPAYGAREHQGGLEQTYAEDDTAYEAAAPRRGRKIALVLAGFVIAGGGLAYAYSALLGPGSDAAPPVVKSAEGPFKVKPSDPGGKQFAHADSKVMGRLGEGGASSAEAGAQGGLDANGARKVPILSVGRDGSIQPPPAATEQTTATVAVPGMTVIDGLGGSAAAPAASQAKPEPSKTVTASEPSEPLVVTPPAGAAKKPPAKIVNAGAPAATPPAQAASPLADDAIGAEAEDKKPPALKKPATVTAAVNPSATQATGSQSIGPQPTGAGYVAVLASVPASSKSRMDALKQFADMQQKYGALLQNKTPDVQEANLGEKGTYHRLLVGPPGSREAASTLCTQLKEQGYTGCWVTAY